MSKSKTTKTVNVNVLKIVTMVIFIGFIIMNFGSLIGYFLIGALVLVGGVFGYSYYQAMKEDARTKKK